MSDFFATFDPQEQTQQEAYSILPDGNYSAMVIGAVIKDTKAKNGKLLEVMFEVYGARFSGRRLWAMFNIENPNPRAVEIARRELSQLCMAIGVLRPRGPEDLIDGTCIVQVGHEEWGGEMRNRAKRYLPSAHPSQAVPNATSALPSAKSPTLPAAPDAPAPWSAPPLTDEVPF